jgi:hypothetical protein
MQLAYPAKGKPKSYANSYQIWSFTDTEHMYSYKSSSI